MRLAIPRRFSLAALSLILLAFGSTRAAAQGANDCANAVSIVGPGAFAVSTIGATDSPQQTGLCPVAHCDVWFVWTSTMTATMEVSLCGGTTMDTVLAVYPGPGCPAAGTQLACNDDACGAQSTVDFDAVSGSTYLIQIGSFSAGQTFSGSFSIATGLPCGGNTGPDIIVGDLQDIANYPGAIVGGIAYDAVAFGTYACNIGTVWANWIASGNQHPVIGNSLYKYSTVSGATRIEQIGMSWLKHGFFALSNSLCCSGCQATDGSHLGVRCADPYSAGGNGAQAGASPRWQVDAASGVFTYPPANPGYTGTVARRCQVKVSDLQVSSASVHYFGEAQYVTQDDAAAGNAYNNLSYREVGVAGSGNAWTFSLIAPVVRENPAILAWQALDPGVQVANIDIPGDGRVVLAWKVTDLGGGQWHYEYALFNLNSDLSIQALSVPKGAGVNLANLGFHDIAYHDGDGPGNVDFDGTDWPATNGATDISWATSTFAQNPSANALRWGTLYNFRFDADVAPTSGTLTLSTFKTVGGVTVQADVPGNPQSGPFCFGDGTGPVPCPCNNAGAAGHGCANSQNPAGALLTAAGTTSPDTLTLTSSGQIPAAFSILLQGSADLALPLPFGDGLRCIGGQLSRLYVDAGSGGVVVFPPSGALPISAQSALKGDALLPGAMRSYQVYSRDANAAFCPAPAGDGWNVSNAQRVVW